MGEKKMGRSSGGCTRHILCLWLVVVIIGISMMGWNVALATMKYLSYPLETNIEFYHHVPTFPAVTICNLNQIRRSAFGGLADIQDESATKNSIRRLFRTESTLNDESVPNWSNKSGQTFRDWNTEEKKHNDVDSDFTFLNDFLANTAQLPPDEMFRYGHQMKDMLLSCSFQGKKCFPSNFTAFPNYLYGNCFTFNLNGELNITKVGPLYGLVLEMFIEQDEYIEYSSKSAGLRVAIHSQSEMPFPEDNGFSASPGARTSVGLRKSGVNHLGPPYGLCGMYSDEENKNKNAYVNDIPTVGYTSEACKRTCLQQQLLQKCDCFHYKIPFNVSIRAYENITYNKDANPCHLNNQTVTCLETIEQKYNQNQLECSSTCPVTCRSDQYDVSVSTAMYPSTRAEDMVLSKLVDQSEKVYDLLTNSTDDERNRYVRDNVLKLEIYFDSLRYEVSTSHTTYWLDLLLSDIGGTAGLWLVLSIIAFLALCTAIGRRA